MESCNILSSLNEKENFRYLKITREEYSLIGKLIEDLVVISNS